MKERKKKDLKFKYRRHIAAAAATATNKINQNDDTKNKIDVAAKKLS